MHGTYTARIRACMHDVQSMNHVGSLVQCNTSILQSAAAGQNKKFKTINSLDLSKQCIENIRKKSIIYQNILCNIDMLILRKKINI